MYRVRSEEFNDMKRSLIIKLFGQNLWITMGCVTALLMAIWYGTKLGVPGYFVGAFTGFLGFYGIALTVYKLNKWLREKYANMKRRR